MNATPNLAPSAFALLDETTSLSPLQQLLLAKQGVVEDFLQSKQQQSYPPITCSVDLRQAHYKLAPVDTNLFPAGFNNLHRSSYERASAAFRDVLALRFPRVKRLLLIPENHTRNLFYLTNLAYLRDILIAAGLEVRLGSLNETLTHPTEFQGNDDSKAPLLLEPLVREGNRLTLQDFDPDLILLNNDLSDGIPSLFDDLEQPLRPLSTLGWAKRLKTKHFSHYQDLAGELATLLDCDPWLINPLFLNCGQVNFLAREGESCIAKNTEVLLEKIKRKYDEYHIKDKPYIIVKADSGTYGMGVMVLHEPDQIYELNRKGRTKMNKSKSGQAISKVILQEGVYSHEASVNPPATAEPVIYMFGHHIIGSFYRLHPDKASDGILNSPGMQFKPMPACDSQSDHFYSYSVIARLAALAGGRELQEAEHANT